MKAVLQRVSGAEVKVDGLVVGRVAGSVRAGVSSSAGLVVLLGVEEGDTEDDSVFLAQKTAELRIFPDQHHRMNLSITDVSGSILVISQFTLIADWRKGRRPGFTRAARPQEGERLYLHYVDQLRSRGIHVETGIFGAHMDVNLTNDGPVTLILENQFGKEGSTTANNK